MGCGASTPAKSAEDAKPAAAPAPPAETAAAAPPPAKPAAKAEPVAAEDPGRKALLEDLFDECDDDGSGALSLDEFAQIFDKKMSSAEDIKAALKMVDVDQADGKLSKEEFVKYHLKKFAAVDDGIFQGMITALLKKAEDETVIDEVPAEIAAEPPNRPEAAAADAAAPSDPTTTRFNTLIMPGEPHYPAAPKCKVAVVQFKIEGAKNGGSDKVRRPAAPPSPLPLPDPSGDRPGAATPPAAGARLVRTSQSALAGPDLLPAAPFAPHAGTRWQPRRLDPDRQRLH